MWKYSEVIFGVVEIIVGICLYEGNKSISMPMFLWMLGGYHIGKGLYKEEK